MTDRLRSSAVVRYAITCRDLNFARQVCDLLLTEQPDTTSTHYWAYHTAAVTAYARPFTEMRPLGKLPGSELRFLSREERSLHELVLEERSTARAHSDISTNPVLFSPAAATVGQDDPHAREPFFGVMSDPWPPHRWEDLKALTDRLCDHFMGEAFRLIEQLGGRDALTHAVMIEIE
jgi:hypothetical protein